LYELIYTKESKKSKVSTISFFLTAIKNDYIIFITYVTRRK